MRIALIACHARNLVIGRNGSLPWHIPEDLQHFKRRTDGHPVVMGRRVYQELGAKPLPGRYCVVLSRTSRFDNAPTLADLKQALDHLRELDYRKIYIIGGESIYREALQQADYLEITEIHEDYDGDVHFPEYRHDIGTVWREVQRTDRDGYSFVDYERIT